MAENNGYAQRFVPRMVDFFGSINGVENRRK
jgi:hypothetical protein